MSRGRKIGLIAGASLLGLLLLIVIAGIAVVQTSWFHAFVREKIVASVEEASGGKVDLGSFNFQWTKLQADVNDFVVHGLEPAGSPPLFRIKHVQVNLKLLSPLSGFVDIAYLLVDTPQANIMVFPDGRTNIPAPKVKKKSDQSPVETIVNLAIGKFDLVNASTIFTDRPARFDAAGQNLRANLTYNAVHSSYAGEIDVVPLFIKSGDNASVNVNVRLPLTMEKDKITLDHAEMVTTQSKVVVSGEMDSFNAPTPHTSAHVNADVAVDDVRRIAGLTIPLDLTHGPRSVTADITASADGQRVEVQSARVTLGGSSIEAKGALQDVHQPAGVNFNATLALGELGRMLKLAQRPEGIVKAGGNAKLGQNHDYLVTANLEARSVGIQQGTTRLTGINFDSSVTADPHRIDLAGLRLAMLGGEFTGAAGIDEMRRFHVAGNLRDFDIPRIASAWMSSPPGYDGIVSGPVDARGDLEDAAGLVAHAALAIAPGAHGVPVSGRLNADYNGRAGDVVLNRSYLQLPHTRMDLSGALGRQIEVRLVTHNLDDFRPLGNIPLTLNNGGAATVNATITGSLGAPRVSAHAALDNFAAEGRSFTSFAADLDAAPNGATVSRATLTHGALQANFSASAGLRDWKPENDLPLRADATIRNADLADVLALAGQSPVSATGVLTVDAHIAGTIGSPTGNADIAVHNGTVEGERLDSLTAHAVMTPQAIDVPTLSLVSGASRIDANASFQHPVNDLARGSVRAHLASNQVQLAQFQSLVKDRPGLQGVLSLNGDAAANLQPGPSGTDFQIANLNANVSVRGLQMEGKNLGDLTATASTAAGNALQYNVNSDFAGSTIRVSGRSLLTGNHDTTADASIANLPIDQALAVAGRRDLPVNGTFSANGQVSGTLQDPRVTASLTVVKGSAWQEPFDRLQANLSYSSQSIELPSFRLDVGPSYLTANGAFTHPAGDMEDGQVRFHAQSNQVQLARLHKIQEARPGLAGAIQLTADGAATLRKGAAPEIGSLNANLSARDLTVDQKPLGNLTANATTRGQEVAFDLTSDLAHSNIKGSGTLQLAADYPLNATLSFDNVTYSGLGPLLGGAPQTFDASANGIVTVTGPVGNTDQLRGTLNIAKLEAHSAPAPTGRKPRVNFELHNAAPIVAALDRSVVTVQSAHITGPFTEFNVTGTAAIANAKTVNLRADGNVRLDILEAFDPDLFAAGNIALNAAVTGTTDQPAVNGRLQLQNASLNLIDAPNGLTNANGTVLFNGTQATIQNLTGETGGGKITLAGNVTYGGPTMQLRVTANADKVRVEYPESVSTQLSARLTVAGSTARSLVSGTVTIEDVALHSHSDIGSMLTQAATPPSAATATSGFMAGVRFDVKIQTAPGIQFRTTLTQNLQADASLTLRGTPDHPGMLGRLQVTRGDVVFFGSKYTIDQGTISFYDPNRINPVLNIALETTVQGVDVSLTVTGPMDRMKLSYLSDPPMQQSDLISLLASGKPPSTDPVLAARQPAPLQQNFEQSGMSTLLGQAVANPVSGRLERLFGVSKFKIDPQITGTSNTPAATMTLQQQITREITFTYIQDVTQSNPQIIRMEWAINPQFSAIAQRDLNGIFDLDFFWKKRFH